MDPNADCNIYIILLTFIDIVDNLLTWSQLIKFFFREPINDVIQMGGGVEDLHDTLHQGNGKRGIFARRGSDLRDVIYEWPLG